MQISKRLTEERERLGLTQTEMAKRGGVAFRTYCDYEAGKSEPRGSFFQDAAAVGMDIQYVITGTPSPAALTPDERELVRSYRAAPPPVKAAVQAALTAGTAPSKHGQNFQGANIGQQVTGDLNVNQPQTFNFGSGKKKK